MKLYYHKTDGGAEYLCSEFIDCGCNGKDFACSGLRHQEGDLKSKFVIRIDGDIKKDAELIIKPESKHIVKPCGACGDEAVYFVEINEDTTLYLCGDCCHELSTNQDCEDIGGKEVGIYSCSEECRECNAR